MKTDPRLPKVISYALAVIVVIGLGSVACNKKETAVKDFDAPSNDAAALRARVKTGVKPEPDAEVAVIRTADYGMIVIELYPNVAPQMVARFKDLIKVRFYDGTTFHRIDPKLGIIQGGDPLSKDDDPQNDGHGDSSLGNLPAELSDVPFERGTVGAARRGATPEGVEPALTEIQALDTANCQFYITLQRQAAFDQKYTVFGKVIQGISNADIIAGAPVAPETDRPADKIVIKSISLEPRTLFTGSEGR